MFVLSGTINGKFVQLPLTPGRHKVGRGGKNKGSLNWKVEHRHKYTDIPPSGLGFESGYVGLRRISGLERHHRAKQNDHPGKTIPVLLRMVSSARNDDWLCVPT